jgi:hypothetical protein
VNCSNPSEWKAHNDQEAKQFRRWEGIREMAQTVLGTHIVLCPSSDGITIQATRKTPGFGDRIAVTIHVSRVEITDSLLPDVVALNMMQAIKDVGGLNVLHA